MKIILAAGIFPPDIGGPATYTAQLAEALVQQGHTVTVVCFSDSEESLGEKYPVIRVKRSWFKIGSHHQYLQALMRVSRGADCLYAQGPTAGGWQARTVAKRLRLPLVVKVVGDYAWEQARVRFGLDCTIEEFQTKQDLPLTIERLRTMQHSVVTAAQKVVVPSQYLAGLVQGWGVNFGRCIC
jgi:glycosyltransferase involved in cell wall biosynthesis